MKKTVVLAALMMIIFSCINDDGLNIDVEVSTGIISNIKYGEGDCMPANDEAQREYKNYNGLLYFILKSDLDNLNDGSLDELKSKSLAEIVVNGVVKRNLPVGTYVIMPKEINLYDESNTIIIKSKEVIKKDFKFWRCITE